MQSDHLTAKGLGHTHVHKDALHNGLVATHTTNDGQISIRKSGTTFATNLMLGRLSLVSMADSGSASLKRAQGPCAVSSCTATFLDISTSLLHV